MNPLPLDRYVTRREFASYEEFQANFRIRVPESFNFAFDVVDELARTQPGKTAMVWCNDTGTEATFTFAEMKEQSARCAQFLHSRGVRKGDPVLLILKRRYEFWFALLACHKLGAVAIPATHLLTVKDLAYRIQAADIRAVVCVNEELIRGHVEAAEAKTRPLTCKILAGADRTPRAGWLDFNAGLDAAPAEFPRPAGAEASANTDPFLLYFTSGTTGMPKMVLHNYTYPLGHILTAKYWQNVEPDGLHLTVADTGWAKAAWGKIYGQWLAGCAVMTYDYDKFVPKQMLEVLQKYGVTSFCAPPTVFRFLIKESLEKYRFPKLRYCTVAGEPLNPEVYQAFLKGTGLKLMEGYGQTELTPTVCTFPWMEPRPGSMGRPAPGYDVDLVDEHGRSCEAGEEGEIILRTREPIPGMFTGYHRDPELTRSVWHDGIYRTGDMAWRDEDGYFWFVGRADDVIKSSGYRIGPFEVESALMEHPAVLECAVTGVPDPDRGQVVKATVVTAKGWTAGPELAEELQEHVKKTTAPYKYPRLVEFVAELPKTISGKIRRVEIRGGRSGSGG